MSRSKPNVRKRPWKHVDIDTGKAFRSFASEIAARRELEQMRWWYASKGRSVKVEKR